jgi:pimeloyl-ACP methyl ester carboxylesterase
MRTHVAAVAVLVVLGATMVLAAPAPAHAGSDDERRVGSIVLERCEQGTRWWCGSLRRPLDPARSGGRRISVSFRWLPASRPGARRPALVAVEGGPGYPSTGSRAEFTGIYGPLLRERDLLLVDNRGTGDSALIDCPALQRFAGDTSRPSFPPLVAGCARQLERRYGRGAADLFSTAYAVGDLAAVLRALRLGRVDLFGDSYGTYFVQSFIARHHDLLRSVVLDSPYPVRDLDPWYASSGRTARAAMDAVCARDLGCAAAAGAGTATARLGALLDRLRGREIAGATRDADGSAVRLSVGVREVADLVQDAGSEPAIYRELDPSVRAALAGDEAPLLRLVAQSRTYLHSAGSADGFSNGLYWAVACADYPQLFAMGSTPAARRTQLAARLRTPPAGAFDPFTAPEWLEVSAYSQPYTGCLDWPRPIRSAPPLPAEPAPLPASIPILIVGGDLDSLTPLADAETFGPTLGARVRVVTLPNTTHVTSQGYTSLLVGTACARRVIRAFVRAPAELATLDASCAGAIPQVHTAGAYPELLDAAAPAALVAGPDPGERARKAATVAAGALADAPVRWSYAGAARGPGLRGGSFMAAGDERVRLRFRSVRFVRDATVSGTGSWRPAGGAHSGSLVVAAPGQPGVRVELSWTQRSRTATARIGAATLALPAP